MPSFVGFASLAGVVVITAARELARRLASDGYEVFGLSLDSSGTDWFFREGLPNIVLGAAMLGFMILRPNGLLDDREIDVALSRRRRRLEPTPARSMLSPIDHE